MGIMSIGFRYVNGVKSWHIPCRLPINFWLVSAFGVTLRLLTGFEKKCRWRQVSNTAEKEKPLLSGAKPTAGFLLPSAAPCSKTDINSTSAAMGKQNKSTHDVGPEKLQSSSWLKRAGWLSLSFLCISSALTINANKTEIEIIALKE